MARYDDYPDRFWRDHVSYGDPITLYPPAPVPSPKALTPEERYDASVAAIISRVGGVRMGWLRHDLKQWKMELEKR